MSDRNDSFLTWKINNGLFGWDHEYARLIDMAYEKGVDSGIYELARLQAEIEALRAQVAELEKCVDDGSDAWLLREQAEAVEDFAAWCNNRWCATTVVGVEADAEEYTKRLRQQADEAEKDAQK